MNVLMNLISLYNHLPYESTYRTVAKGILNNLDLMADATIFDVVEITASSRTTIWRMLKMLGYDSYSEFHHELKKIVTRYSYYNRGLPVAKSSSNQDIIHMAASQLRESADIVEKVASEQFLMQIVECLHHANRVSFYDFPSTSCYFLIQNLAMSGKETGLFSLWPKMMDDAKRLTSSSVVFAYPLETPDMKDFTPIFEVIKKKGAILILDSHETSRYRPYGNYIMSSPNLSLQYPLSRRHVFEMMLIIISEIYRNRYL